MMSDIYSSASVTLIWLGPPTDPDGALAAFIEQLYIAVDFKTFAKAPIVNLDTAGLRLPHLKSSLWTALFELMTRTWFSRVWVIQESVLSLNPMFCYGKHMFSKEMFYHAAFILIFKNVRGELSLYQASQKRSRISGFWVPGWNSTFHHAKEDESKVSFLGALLLTQGFAATNPKDKYFAIINLISGVPPNFVNYERSLKDIIIDAAKHVLTTGSLPKGSGRDGPAGLDILSFVNGRRSLDELECLPSWVPELSYENKAFSGLSKLYPSAKLINIGECEFRFSVNDVSLP
jgi:Heterokaryon incompatibility protein (HET)